jgi:hypothetical protein
VELRGFLGRRCENPLCQWVGPGYAVQAANESGSARARREPRDDFVGVRGRRLAPVGRTSHNTLGSDLFARRHHTSDRCWADRQPGEPALGIPEVDGGFP